MQLEDQELRVLEETGMSPLGSRQIRPQTRDKRTEWETTPRSKENTMDPTPEQPATMHRQQREPARAVYAAPMTLTDQAKHTTVKGAIFTGFAMVGTVSTLAVKKWLNL